MLIVTQVLFLKADCFTAAWFSVVTERCPGCGRLCRRPQNQNIARWYHWFSCSSNGLLLRRIFGMEKKAYYTNHISLYIIIVSPYPCMNTLGCCFPWFGGAFCVVFSKTDFVLYLYTHYSNFTYTILDRNSDITWKVFRMLCFTHIFFMYLFVMYQICWKERRFSTTDYKHTKINCVCIETIVLSWLGRNLLDYLSHMG